MSKTYGYARVSSKEQHLDRQILRYSRYGETVLAFDAIDLLEILQEGEDEFIQFLLWTGIFMIRILLFVRNRKNRYILL